MRNLYLYHNKLTVIGKLMFFGLVNMEKIWLNTNEIHQIEVESFKQNTGKYTPCSKIPVLRKIYPMNSLSLS